MDSHTLFNELKRLMKENKKAYIGIMLALVLLLSGIILLPTLLNTFGNLKDSEEVSKQSHINPAIFEMYIEYDTGSSFTNTILLEQAMKKNEFIEGAEKTTGIEISDLLDYETEIDYPKSAKDRGVLGASRDEASNIWVFSANIGSQEENLAVINYFYNLFVNNEVELLQNKSRYIISEPRILTDEELLSPTTPVEQEGNNQLSIKNILFSVILAVLGAAALSFIILIIKSFTTKKIQYAFNYSWSEQDLFMLNSKDNQISFNQMFKISSNRGQVYLAQEPESINIPHAEIVDSITKYNVQGSLSEIIILVQPNVTDKKWYSQQRELLKVFPLPLKIVQMND